MRIGTWERALADYLRAMESVVFSFGEADCALFAAGAVLAMTGNDPAKAFRGRYKSHASAVRALRQIGAGDLESTIDSLFEVKPPAFAQRGDLVWEGESVGVCIGADALFVGEEEGRSGLVRIARAAWLKAWTVG
ncbi:DUF6950 family protein [Sphingobium boeckii]|uniref:DUF6950 domain-containing protein n=1 Tax=Sphingobium boeckii TaxID=1082345 RepID=A0A7W9AF55_9SPHN|nr:hypothetical protein [Sphingobium boeckii]MBB5684286.1 hypothetical protein [Sphingobium boeckii]